MSSYFMANRFGYLLLSTLYFVIRCGSCRITNVKNRPFGPLQCIETCQYSPNTSGFIKTYHCLRVRTTVPGRLTSHSIKDVFTCVQKGKAVGNTLPVVSHGQAKNKVEGESPVIERLPNTMLTHDKKTVQCRSDINLPKACEKGKVDEVQNILSQADEDINCRWEHGRTPVMIAAEMGQMAVFDFLVNKGCDLLAVDNSGDSVLHVACVGGNTNIVKVIVKDNKFDVDKRGKDGRTPVMMAVLECRMRVVHLLVSYDCDMTAVDDDNDTILHWACYGGCEDILEYVLSTFRINLESRGADGRTPVTCAVESCDLETVKFLERKGCNLNAVDYRKNNVLHFACSYGCYDVVAYLLSKDINSIDSRGHFGCTPVMFASEHGHIEVVKLLERKGSNLYALDDTNDTILHYACIGGSKQLVEYILSKDVISIESRGQDGTTPVMCAAEYCHKELVKILERKGSNLNAVDDTNDTILHYACSGGCKHVVDYVLSKDVISIESRGKFGRTPVMRAISNCSLVVFNLLVKRGCNLTAVDNNNDTILHLACSGGCENVVEYVLSKNIISIESRGKYGRTPAMMAAENGHKRLVDLLIKNRL